MPKEQDLSQIAKGFQADLKSGFNTLDMLMIFYQTDKKLIGSGVQIAAVAAKLIEVEKIRSEQSTATQHIQEDSNKIAAKKQIPEITTALQNVHSELNNFGTKFEELQRFTVELKSQMNAFTSANTAGTLKPEEINSKRKEMHEQTVKAKKQLDLLLVSQKQIAAQVTSKNSSLYRMVVSAAADLSIPTNIQQHLMKPGQSA